MRELSLFPEENAGVVPPEPAPAGSTALDELFLVARQYRSSAAFVQLMEFVASFRAYAPFNAMLLHIQRPGATFVAPPSRWLRQYGRRIKPAANPLVILQPMGPVMFVFDVLDTEPNADARPVPPEVVQPFEVSGTLHGELERTVDNAKRDGVAVSERDEGSQSAGSIRVSQGVSRLQFCPRGKRPPQHSQIRHRYDVVLNSKHSRETRYSSLVHELAHLYCGHLGSPSSRWWPDRRGLPKSIRELEAEAVAFLVCRRLGLEPRSAEYLAEFMRDGEAPAISLDCVMKAAGLIAQMGRERLALRKEPKA